MPDTSLNCMNSGTSNTHTLLLFLIAMRKSLTFAALCLAMTPAFLLAHNLLVSAIDLTDGGITVNVPLTELARAEHVQAISAPAADAAIRRRLEIAGLGPSTLSIDPVTDRIVWTARLAGSVRITKPLFPEIAQSATRLRRANTPEVWLNAEQRRPSGGDFLLTGFRHVLEGQDHIAFLLGLVLLGGSLGSLAWTVTAFTLAHSITLGLAALGILNPPSRLIEPMIALSIIAVALENLYRRGSLHRRPYIAFVFGLVHGFGVAAPLRELAITPFSLLPLNAGVEAAQALIVLTTWPVLRWFGRHQPVIMARLALAGSCIIGIAGAYWLADRTVVFAQSPDDVAAKIEATFRPWKPKVVTRHDAAYFYVESNGMPDHRMMVGITAWQQQTPLPQPYTGDNAWRFPLFARPATAPLSAKDHFFRGAIAIAANGVPIFNPIKNDGHTDTFLAGELDEFGGHGGRADDYHYHTAPLHLQKELGPATPIAWALDGYPILGLTEPDGSTPARLDAFNGHTGSEGYHYHSTKTYPYLNGGFHGEVSEVEGQVDPQPRAIPVRPSGEPLRGATVTGFEKNAENEYTLTYMLRGQTNRIHYVIRPDQTYVFDYIDGAGKVTTETYVAGRGRGGRGRGGPGGRGRGPGR